MSEPAPELPAVFAEIRDEFRAVTAPERLQLLLEFAAELPELPERYREHPDLLERVEECQSPVWLFAELDGEGRVHVAATAPEQAPTTRGFASIVVQGFEGLSADEALAVPGDYPFELALAEAVSPLRLRGMVGMLSRVQRRIRAQAGS